VLDDELDEKSAEFAAISIEGPKAVGKTETAQRRARTDYRLDGPAGEVVAANPQVVLAGEPPILIDEWQRVPATWDVVRRAIDDGAPPGSYLLAGSDPYCSHLLVFVLAHACAEIHISSRIWRGATASRLRA
jgi:uncharacterized protein